MAESAMKNMALGVAGSRYKHALNHLVNLVWLNTFENLSISSSNIGWLDPTTRGVKLVAERNPAHQQKYDATPCKSWRFPCKEKPYNPSRKTDTLGFTLGFCI
jgi:hypothetical protein